MKSSIFSLRHQQFLYLKFALTISFFLLFVLSAFSSEEINCQQQQVISNSNSKSTESVIGKIVNFGDQHLQAILHSDLLSDVFKNPYSGKKGNLCNENKSLNYDSYRDFLSNEIKFNHDQFLSKLSVFYKVDLDQLKFLSQDSDHNGLATVTSILEVASVLEAQKEGLFGDKTLPITRAVQGLDFAIGDKLTVDIKTPPLVKGITFNIQHVLRSIKKKIHNHSNDDAEMYIVLDETFLNSMTREELNIQLKKNLTEEEYNKIIFVCLPTDFLDSSDMSTEVLL